MRPSVKEIRPKRIGENDTCSDGTAKRVPIYYSEKRSCRLNVTGFGFNGFNVIVPFVDILYSYFASCFSLVLFKFVERLDMWHNVQTQRYDDTEHKLRHSEILENVQVFKHE